MRTLNRLSLSFALVALMTAGVAAATPVAFADCGPNWPTGCKQMPEPPEPSQPESSDALPLESALRQQLAQLLALLGF